MLAIAVAVVAVVGVVLDPCVGTDACCAVFVAEWSKAKAKLVQNIIISATDVVSPIKRYFRFDVFVKGKEDAGTSGAEEEGTGVEDERTGVAEVEVESTRVTRGEGSMGIVERGEGTGVAGGRESSADDGSPGGCNGDDVSCWRGKTASDRSWRVACSETLSGSVVDCGSSVTGEKRPRGTTGRACSSAQANVAISAKRSW